MRTIKEISKEFHEQPGELKQFISQVRREAVSETLEKVKESLEFIIGGLAEAESDCQSKQSYDCGVGKIMMELQELQTNLKNKLKEEK